MLSLSALSWQATHTAEEHSQQGCLCRLLKDTVYDKSYQQYGLNGLVANELNQLNRRT